MPAASPRKNPAAFLVAGIALSIAILVIGIALIVRQARVGSPGLPTLVVEATQPPSSTTQADAGIGQFALYYDQNSLYLRNISGDTPSLQALAFERLDASGTPLNRFDGANWAKFYPRLEAGWCVRLEIIDSPAWLRPAECGNRYRSTRTPNRDSDWIFWTPQEASLEFRVLWQGDEVARCEIAAGTCSFDLR